MKKFIKDFIIGLVCGFQQGCYTGYHAGRKFAVSLKSHM